MGTVSIESSERLSRCSTSAASSTRRAQRQEPRARGADRGPGRPRGRRDHRHQHGRPRHRHPAGRQPRGHGRGPAARARATRTPMRRGGIRPTAAEPTRHGGHARPLLRAKQCDAEHDAVIEAGGLCVIGTERHESPTHRQPAARPFRPPGRPRHDPVLPVAGRRPHAAVSAATAWTRSPHDGEDRHARRHAHPGRHGLQGHRERPAPGGEHALRRPQERAGIRRRHEPAARGHLRASATPSWTARTSTDRIPEIIRDAVERNGGARAAPRSARATTGTSRRSTCGRRT